jgi:hypothetical protein
MPVTPLAEALSGLVKQVCFSIKTEIGFSYIGYSKLRYAEMGQYVDDDAPQYATGSIVENHPVNPLPNVASCAGAAATGADRH